MKQFICNAHTGESREIVAGDTVLTVAAYYDSARELSDGTHITTTHDGRWFDDKDNRYSEVFKFDDDDTEMEAGETIGYVNE